MRISAKSLILLVVLAANSMLLKADVIRTWYLEDVSFPASGPVTGSFDFDASTGSATAASISTGLGTFTYLLFSGAEDLGLLRSSDAQTANWAGAPVFILNTFIPMTDAGGTIPLNNVIIDRCADAICSTGNAEIPGENDPGYPVADFITTSTPEPAAHWLVGFGVFLLGCVHLRRRRIPATNQSSGEHRVS